VSMNPMNRRVGKDKPEGEVAPRVSVPPAPRKYGKLVAIARGVVGFVLVVGISSAVAWGARNYVKHSPRFAVTDIEVSGGHHRSEDVLIMEAGIDKGANIFTLDLDRAKAKLLADPWISSAELARRLPGTIFLKVTEREAGAIVALGESYLASREGEIFKRLEAGDPVELPIITGISETAVAEDRDGVKEIVRRALDLAGDYDHSSLGRLAPLQEIHVGGDGAITVIVGKNALSLALGEPPFRRKLEQAARVMVELEHRGAKADAIMLDNEARPERVVVRMR
jgi:cell division protein FtsQ